MAEERAPDQAARDRIRQELGSSLFVEAGAGSGKTTALVSRVLALIATGTAELGSVAAITFTDKAAQELRDRIRHALEDEVGRADDAVVTARCRAALDELDSAAIGTLHSFAHRLLTEHPIEAGLPPRVEVLDEVSSGVEFEHRWKAFLDHLLADAPMERTLLLLDGCGVGASALRSLAVAFERDWDLVAERVPAEATEPPDVRSRLEAALAGVDAVCADRAHCSNPGDTMVLRLDEIAGHAARLRSFDDELDLLEALDPKGPVKPPSFRAGTLGHKATWTIDKPDLIGRIRAAGEGLAAVRDAVAKASAEAVGSAIRRFTLHAADERQAAGRLEFHDLLVLSRRLVRDADHGPSVRRQLHERYTHLLLDEFQDTDPIQIELAVRIAAEAPEEVTTGAEPWAKVSTSPGHLFVVGDPKQSIYRFRRADIATFLAARDRFGSASGGVVELTANFRTVGPVIDWVNQTFDTLMAAPPALQVPMPSQPAYMALQATREPPPQGPCVSVLGRTVHHKGDLADDLRAAEATEVAATVARVMRERWSVGDGSGGWRPARLGDVTVLVPARTSLPFLENALSASGVAYRAEASSLVYATRAVRDLLAVLRAVDDPSDHLRIVSALRTPLLACGDDDLYRFKVERRGHWDYTADQPGTLPDDDPVGLGLAYLWSLHHERHWRSPSELLDRIVRDRRALELGVVEGRPRDVWRRLRFIIDQARAWSDATGGSLRSYLHWVGLQSTEGARVAEAVLPETDDDAVRIMTIHAAKGLEFPITIVSGLTTAPKSQRAAADVCFPPDGTVGYRFGANVMTEVFEDFKPIDEQLGFDERIRLLYVACTRAQDHLVVSLHRKAPAKEQSPNTRTNAELLVDGMGELLDSLPDGADTGALSVGPSRPVTVAAATAPSEPPPFEQWEAELTTALGRAGRATTVAATAITHEGRPDVEAEPDAGLQKRQRDLDLPPWLKGRYGTAVGRAVHGVLQTIDLATGAGLEDAVAAQCQAEAIPGRAEDVGRLVRQALGAPSVQEAARASHWREVYACTPVGDRLLEGYVDLLYRTAEGLVVVDHKTAATVDPHELDRRVEGYRLQGASYALAVAAATGEEVVRVTFLFLTPTGAVERHLADLDAAIEDVRAQVTAGEEVTVV